MTLIVRSGTPENPGNEILQTPNFSETFLPNSGDSMVINNAPVVVLHRRFGYVSGVYIAELFVG